MEGVADKIRVDLSKGLNGSDYPERTEHFGNNVQEKPEVEGFWAKFFDALQDFMLKVLIVAGAFSIIVDMIVSGEEERKTGKFRIRHLFFSLD